jgi:hypothetical protein
MAWEADPSADSSANATSATSANAPADACASRPTRVQRIHVFAQHALPPCMASGASAGHQCVGLLPPVCSWRWSFCRLLGILILQLNLYVYQQRRCLARGKRPDLRPAGSTARTAVNLYRTGAWGEMAPKGGAGVG